MRKIIYSMMVSLDGFVELPGHDLSWVLVDEEIHTFINEQQKSEVDTYLYGRGMYETMTAFWPTAHLDPSHPSYVTEFAYIWQSMPKIVFSQTLDHVEGNAILLRGDIAEEVARLKAQPGKDIELGGAHIAASLMRLGLIDEFRLFVNPVVLGSGTHMFAELNDTINLQLLETRRFQSGVVYLRYQRVDQSQEPLGSQKADPGSRAFTSASI